VGKKMGRTLKKYKPLVSFLLLVVFSFNISASSFADETIPGDWTVTTIDDFNKMEQGAENIVVYDSGDGVEGELRLGEAKNSYTWDFSDSSSYMLKNENIKIENNEASLLKITQTSTLTGGDFIDDTYINQSFSNFNYGGSDRMYINKDGGTEDDTVGFIRPVFTNNPDKEEYIPKSAKIEKVISKLTRGFESEAGYWVQIELYRLKDSLGGGNNGKWEEGSQNGSEGTASWNSYADSNSWPGSWASWMSKLDEVRKNFYWFDGPIAEGGTSDGGTYALDLRITDKDEEVGSEIPYFQNWLGNFFDGFDGNDLNNGYVIRFDNKGTGAASIGTSESSITALPCFEITYSDCYPLDLPYLYPKSALDISGYSQINEFSEEAVKADNTEIYYQIGDGTNYYYWNGSQWAVTTSDKKDDGEYNTSSVVNEHIKDFLNQINPKPTKFLWRALFWSSGDNNVILKEVSVTLDPKPGTSTYIKDFGARIDLTGITWNTTHPDNESQISLYLKDKNTDQSLVLQDESGDSIANPILINENNKNSSYSFKEIPVSILKVDIALNGSPYIDSSPALKDFSFDYSYTPLPAPTAKDTTVYENKIDWNFSYDSGGRSTTGFILYDANTDEEIKSVIGANTTKISEDNLQANKTYNRYIRAYENSKEFLGTALSVSTTTLPAVPSNISSNPEKNGYFKDAITFTNDQISKGEVSYYRYIFNQNSSHVWATNDEGEKWDASSLKLSANTEGNWYLHIRSFNSAGAVNSTSSSVGPFICDKTAPGLSLENPTEGAILEDKINLSYSISSENLKELVLTLNWIGGTTDPFAPHTISSSNFSLNKGSYNLELNTTDLKNDGTEQLNDGAYYEAILKGTDPAGNITEIICKNLKVEIAKSVSLVSCESLVPANVYQGDKNVPIAELKLSASSGEVNLLGLELTSGGNGSDSDVEKVKVYRDNGNGIYDGSDSQLNLGEVFVNGKAQINFISSEKLTASTSVYYIAFDISPSAVVGKTVGFELLNTSVFRVESPHGVNTFSTVEILTPSIAATVDSVIVASTTDLKPSLTQGNSDIALARIALKTESNSALLNAVSITKLGNIEDDNISEIKICEDSGDGKFVSADDKSLASGEFINGKISLNLSTKSTITTATRYYFITASLNSEATVGNTFGLTISSISLETPDAISFSSWSTDLGSISATPQTLTVSSEDISPEGLKQSEKSPLAKLFLKSSAQTIPWKAIKITNLGTVSSSDINEIMLYSDTNRNETYDASDLLVTAGKNTFTDDKIVELVFAETQYIDTAGKTYFVAAEVSSSANTTKTLQLYYQQTDFSVDSPHQITQNSFTSKTVQILNVKTPNTPIVIIPEYITNTSLISPSWSSIYNENYIPNISAYALGTSEENDDLIEWTEISVGSSSAFDIKLPNKKYFENGKAYYLTLKTGYKDDLGTNWSISKSVKFIVDLTAPSTPGIPSISHNAATDEYNVNWIISSDAESGIKYYTLQRKRVLSPVWEDVDTLETSSVASESITTLSFATPATADTYTFRIKTTNGAGLETFSDESQPQGMGTLSSSDLISSVSNYPNPFDSRIESTKIVYTLNKDANININIYDLFGRLVKKFEYSKGQTGKSTQYANEVVWDGANGAGEKVSKGGYIAIIKASVGSESQTVRRKIGVIH
jgi:hypothetical protein